MKLLPQSIRGRLLLTGIVLTAAALIAATFAIDAIMDSFVRRNLNQSLDGQISLLIRAVKSDGEVDVNMLQEIGPYTQYRRGWAWKIETPTHTYTSSKELRALDFQEEGDRGREGHFKGPPETLMTGRAGDLYVSILEKETPSGIVRITATAPHMVYRKLRDSAITPVLATLVGLSAALLLASILQLRIGLQPLDRIKKTLADIRSGKIQRVPTDQPQELRPLVEEMNDLLDANEVALSRARGHVANLAHSLKTPLATLSVKLADDSRDPNGDLAELVTQIDRAIRHHLGRARSASPGAPGGQPVNVADTLADLIVGLRRIYIDRSVEFSIDAPPELTVRCDPQDLQEMLGNLLDNAAKWAASHIAVSVSDEGRQVRIDIEDDGTGLDVAAIAQALLPGGRLDENVEGHGFGLPIARELAELHGGSLELARSARGGLRATLHLPRWGI